MLTFLVISGCLICVFFLVCIAGLIYFLGKQHDNIPIMLSTTLIVFFVAHIVFGWMFSILTEAYNLPAMPWHP